MQGMKRTMKQARLGLALLALGTGLVACGRPNLPGGEGVAAAGA